MRKRGREGTLGSPPARMERSYLCWFSSGIAGCGIYRSRLFFQGLRLGESNFCCHCVFPHGAWRGQGAPGPGETGPLHAACPERWSFKTRRPPPHWRFSLPALRPGGVRREKRRLWEKELVSQQPLGKGLLVPREAAPFRTNLQFVCFLDCLLLCQQIFVSAWYVSGTFLVLGNRTDKSLDS